MSQFHKDGETVLFIGIHLTVKSLASDPNPKARWKSKKKRPDFLGDAQKKSGDKMKKFFDPNEDKALLPADLSNASTTSNAFFPPADSSSPPPPENVKDFSPKSSHLQTCFKAPPFSQRTCHQKGSNKCS
jgi:hypothetical protein